MGFRDVLTHHPQPREGPVLTMKFEGVEAFLKLYRKLRFVGSPFTGAEVDGLENQLGLPLPPAYRAYLLVAGAEPPAELIGSDCHGNCLPQLRAWAEELIEEAGRPFDLPADAVVFLMHQGYQFFYFRADGVNADPPVWYYHEKRVDQEQADSSFSTWVRRMSR